MLSTILFLLLLVLVHDSGAFIRPEMEAGCRSLIVHFCKGDHCAEVWFDEEEQDGSDFPGIMNINCSTGFQLLVTMSDDNNVTEPEWIMCKNVTGYSCGEYCQFELQTVSGTKFTRDISKLECDNRQWSTNDTVVISTVGGTFALSIIVSCAVYFYLRARANRPVPMATTPTQAPTPPTSK